MDSIRILDTISEWLADIRSAVHTRNTLRTLGEDIHRIDGKVGYFEVSYRADPTSEQKWAKGWYLAFREIGALPDQPPILCTWHRNLGSAVEEFRRNSSGRINYRWRE